MRWLKRRKPHDGDQELSRRPLPRRKRLLRRGGLVILLMGICLWFAHTRWQQVAVELVTATVEVQLAKAGFRVERIYLRGRRIESADGIKRALRVQVGDPILSVRLEAARRRLEDLPYVRHASLQRHFPNILVVSIEERRPMALWERNGAMTLIDEEGKVIADTQTPSTDRLVVLTGPDAPEHGADLLAMLSKEPDLRKRVVAAARIGGRRWDIRLNNNITIALPERHPQAAWRKLAQLERRYKLLAKNLLSIDLRLPGQFIFRTRNGKLSPGATNGRTT